MATATAPPRTFFAGAVAFSPSGTLYSLRNLFMSGGRVSESRQAFVAAMAVTHGRQLRRFLAARLRNALADVPDLMQEVFLRLLRIDSHEAIRNPQAYLYTVASHVLHQHTLRQNLAAEVAEPQEWLTDLKSLSATDPAVLAEFELRFERVGRELEALSPRAYATLIMHRFDGMPLEEIARRFGVSRTMVKRYLARALSFCQQQMDEREQAR